MQPVLADKIVWYRDPTFSSRKLPPPLVPKIDIAVPMDDGGLFDGHGVGGGRSRRLSDDMGQRRGHSDDDEMELIRRR